MTQKQTILSHLQKWGDITQLEATHRYMILRLAARIEELRRDGHLIRSETIRVNDKSFAKYRLEA